jgi:hypothetical protein
MMNRLLQATNSGFEGPSGDGRVKLFYARADVFTRVFISTWALEPTRNICVHTSSIAPMQPGPPLPFAPTRRRRAPKSATEVMTA